MKNSFFVCKKKMKKKEKKKKEKPKEYKIKKMTKHKNKIKDTTILMQANNNISIDIEPV